ncbi:magnesium transporter [Candidatus Clavichlamydia salmonicola]|uniref:magnesium transporter n=1 Tax=Candidatus Clavichlamydia salmonicola TaxID=469812 RepID=UPI001891395C|nr:magnesium transporter [Candidatus Clavichlamydia salmonicola]
MDTKTNHLDDELISRLEHAFHHTTSHVLLHDVAKIALKYNPIDLAYAASYLPSAARVVLYENLPCAAAKVCFIINTDGVTRCAIFRRLSDLEVCSLIEKMPTDEVIWVLEDIPNRRYRKVLEMLDVKKAAKIKELQKHGRNTAGRLMTNEFFAFLTNTTILEVANFMRGNPGIDLARIVFILDHKGELQGYVPERNLIINPPEMMLKNIMLKIDHQVAPNATREEVVDIVERYKISALPVVSDENFLLGVITHEDIVEVIEDIADETIALIAGTIESISDYDHHAFRRFLSRAPWLLVTLFAGLISAAVMSYFQQIEPKLLSLIIFFIPLINGMSGNVGVQCSTILVRSMAIGVLSRGKRKDAIIKELSIGLLTGVNLGILCGFIVYLMSFFRIGQFATNSLQIGYTVASGVLGASLTATGLGVFAPFFFVRIGVDPALASGPIVTAFNDVLSMTMFFVISGFINVCFFS